MTELKYVSRELGAGPDVGTAECQVEPPVRSMIGNGIGFVA